jgi:hypothetical protein
MTVIQRNALSGRIINISKQFNLVYFHHNYNHFNHHQQQHLRLVIMELALLMTTSDRTHPEVSSSVFPGSFCILVLMCNIVASPTHQSSSPSRVPTNAIMTTESQRYICFIRNGGNVIPQHACPEAKRNNPITGLTLLWACNPFWGKSNY